jgi:hypothetical protein
MSKNINLFHGFAVEATQTIIGGRSFAVSSFLLNKFINTTPSYILEICDAESMLPTVTEDPLDPKCAGQLFKPKGK